MFSCWTEQLLQLLLLLLPLPQSYYATPVVKVVRNSFVCWRMNAVLCCVLSFHSSSGVKVRRMRRVAKVPGWRLRLAGAGGARALQQGLQSAAGHFVGGPHDRLLPQRLSHGGTPSSNCARSHAHLCMHA